MEGWLPACAGAGGSRRTQDAAGAAAGCDAYTGWWGGGVKVYIAGPMTGIPNLNFPAFHEAARRLRAEGHLAVNPAEINADPSAGWLECMRADIRELVTCEAIFLLPGWELSRGATLERHIAERLGFAILLADEAIA